MLDLKRSARAGIAAEFAGADLGDVRRTRRLQSIAERAMQAPEVGFPRMVANDTELEGLYRFFNSEDVTADAVLAPHIEATFERMRNVAGPVLVVHDTTDLAFGGLHERDGLGPTQGKQQGFLLHLALAVLPGEERVALGVCGLERIVRTGLKKTRGKSWYEMSKDPARESLRWGRLFEQVEAHDDSRERIHLMDREGDNYDLFALMLRKNARFIVRGCHDRALVGDIRLSARLSQLKPIFHREIEVSERPEDGKFMKSRRHPRRRARAAYVSVAGCTVSILQTHSAHAEEEQLTLNVVRVWEDSPPAGEPAISWTLYTSEPIATQKELLAVIDNYRSRWLVEEYFKALKTGCSFEKRQLESYAALSIALAVFLPIAWRLLLLRSVSRKIPSAPASVVVSSVQLQLLQHKLKLAKLPATAEEAVYAVAKLGGHLKRNGAPGWLTLGQGFESLLMMQAGWLAAMAAQRSDQS